MTKTSEVRKTEKFAIAQLFERLALRASLGLRPPPGFHSPAKGSQGWFKAPSVKSHIPTSYNWGMLALELFCRESRPLKAQALGTSWSCKTPVACPGSTVQQ